MSAPRGYGITIPFDRVPLHAQRDWVAELVDLGYTDVWSAETDGTDAFTPLALASVWAPTLRLGTAIVPVFTRGPAVIAQSAAAMSLAAPGRFVLGIGTSSNVIVSGWNGIAFDEPYKRMRDTLR
ncbi:MAG: LLM class flavin-dependent oxidoreductase, partial [Actinobacteria bacterium]|nr:LLM class flavin-dependent oxidoreductase [Actinomycetota bacterium]